jgi:hypothetical protein
LLAGEGIRFLLKVHLNRSRRGRLLTFELLWAQDVNKTGYKRTSDLILGWMLRSRYSQYCTSIPVQ